MITILWFLRMIRDALLLGIVNGSLFMSMALLSLLFSGLLVVAAKLSAPFIYTLF